MIIQKNTMNILVSANEIFLKPLVVALISLHDNTNADTIQVYFINVTLSENQIQWLRKKLSNDPKFSFHCIDVGEQSFEGARIFGHFSIEIYARLLLMKILPKELDRVLWLDADTVVHNNIDSFYNMDIAGHSLVACESIRQNIGEKRQKLNMQEGQKYFNSGILLFNLEYMREHFSEDALMNYAFANMDIIEWPDQDVLNAVCGPSALIIDYHQYNYMHFARTRIDDAELSRIEKENCILHYIGPVKPWSYWFRSKTFPLWQQYAKKSGAYSPMFFWKLHGLKMIQKVGTGFGMEKQYCFMCPKTVRNTLR